MEATQQKTKAEAGTYQGLTAEQWRERAREARQSAADSFERSDTDGFLSQWASESCAREYDLCAQVAENDGKARFGVFFTVDGEILTTKLIKGQFGWSHGIVDPANPHGRFIGWIRESTAATPEKRRAALEKKGYRRGWVEAAARVVARSQGRSYVVNYLTIPADPLLGDAVVLSTDSLDAY